MAKKKSSDKNERGRYSPDQMLGVIAGCPFIGFKPCAFEKCTFFVAIPPKLTDRACIIKMLYTFQIVQSIISQTQFIGIDRVLERVDIPALAHRAAESLVDALGFLEGLATHPKTDAALAVMIRTIKERLFQDMKKFSGP